jgi:hypothetical protein
MAPTRIYPPGVWHFLRRSSPEKHRLQGDTPSQVVIPTLNPETCGDALIIALDLILNKKQLFIQ